MTLTTTPVEAAAAVAVDADSSSNRRAWQRRAMVVACDFLAIGTSLILATVAVGQLAAPTWLLAVYGVSMWGWMVSAQLYNSRLVTNRSEELPRIARSAFRSLLVFGGCGVIAREAVDLRAALGIYAATVAIVSLERELVRKWFASRRESGEALWSSILVAGVDGDKLKQAIGENKSSPHVIVDVLDPYSCDTPDELLTRAVGMAGRAKARGVVIDSTALDRATANRLVRGLLEAELIVDMASPLSDISTERLASRNLGPSVATWIAPRPRTGWRAHAKRVFDVSITIVAGIALMPVWVTVALAVKLSSPGPVFFRQERVGRGEVPFDMLKFRSMVVDAEELLQDLGDENEGAGPLFKMENDPRVTKVGRFIRKTSLDELPQLINVLRDEMSLVGPRPALHAEMADWNPDLFERLQVKPGITGMWQVSGRSSTTFDEYTRLDLYYVHNWSLMTDLSILARTIPAVLKSDGAY